jgi:hypothetical protein
LIALLGETGGEALHQVSDKPIGFFDRASGLIDEAGLDCLPFTLEAFGLTCVKQG